VKQRIPKNELCGVPQKKKSRKDMDPLQLVCAYHAIVSNHVRTFYRTTLFVKRNLHMKTECEKF